MNKSLAENLNKPLVDWEDFNPALSLKKMLDAFLKNRSERIINRFHDDRNPFVEIYEHSNTNVVFTGLKWNLAAFQMEIQSQPGGYKFKFWDTTDRRGRHGRARTMVQLMTCFHADSWAGGILKNEFVFPSQEAEMFEYIAAFKTNLAAAVEGNGFRIIF